MMVRKRAKSATGHAIIRLHLLRVRILLIPLVLLNCILPIFGSSRGCSTSPTGSSFSISSSWSVPPPNAPYITLACLSVTNDRPFQRQEVAYSGVPISKDIMLKDDDLGRLVVVGGNGRRIPAQFDVLSRWSRPLDDISASIRWLETSLPTNISPGPAKTDTFELRLYNNDYTVTLDKHDLSVTSINNRLYRIETGVARFVIDSSQPALLTEAAAFDPSSNSFVSIFNEAGLGTTEHHGPHVTFQPMDTKRFGSNFRTLNPSHAVVTHFEMVHSGPVKATFLVEGVWRSGQASKCISNRVAPYDALTFDLALTFFRGKRDVKIQFHANMLCSDADGSDWTDQSMLIRRAGYSLTLSNGLFSGGKGAQVYYGGNVAESVIGPVSNVSPSTEVSVSQDRGGGSPWKRKARVRRGTTVLHSAEKFDAPLLAVTDAIFVTSITLGNMKYREPQRLTASSGGKVLSIDVIGSQQRVGEGKGIWSIGMITIFPIPAKMTAKSAIQAKRWPAIYECERGLLLHAPPDLLYQSGTYPPLGIPDAPPSIIRSRYVTMMEKLHSDTVQSGGQWDRAKRFGSQLWPDVEFEGWQVDNVANPNQSDPSMGYWNAHAHELIEYLRTGDPKWVHDFSLPQTYLQIFTAYLNIGWNTHDWNRSGLAINSGGSGDGQWHRTDFGSDDYMYNLAVKTAYIVRPDPIFRRRMEVSGRTLRNRYDVSIPESNRDPYVERLDVSRGVLQHLEAGVSCAEFGKGSHGSLTHKWFMDIMQEIIHDNLSTGTICQPDVNLGRRCEQPQTFMQVSMMYEFFVRVYLNYGDLYGGLRKAIVTIPRNLYRFGMQKQADGSIVFYGNHASLLDCTTNSKRTWINSCSKLNNGDGTNILDHNINSLLSALLIADSFEPSLGFCDLVDKAWKNGNAITSSWLSVDFNNAGWTKATSQMMSLIAYGVGWLEICKNPIRPTKSPFGQPASSPPTTSPIGSPLAPTNVPSLSPSKVLVSQTNSPTISSSKNPTHRPSLNPTESPTSQTNIPTTSPSKSPTKTSDNQESEVLLRSSLDNIRSIQSPILGTGGTTTLKWKDFVWAKMKKGVNFNSEGSGKYVRFPTKNNIDLDQGSLSVWYRPTYRANAEDVESVLFCVGDVYSPPNLLLKEGDALHFWLTDASWNTIGVSSTYRDDLWKANQWVFIEVKWDTSNASDSFQIFVNNKRVDTGGAKGGWSIKSALNHKYIYIGAGNAKGHFHARGIIDELSISRRNMMMPVCEDKESFRFNNWKWATCERYAKNKWKCNKWDKKGRLVKNHCPQKCNYCTPLLCDDNSSSFVVWSKERTCESFVTSSWKCSGKDSKKRLIKELCREKCNFCSDMDNQE